MVKYVVKRISDQDFRKTKSPWPCSVKGNVQKTALQSAPTVLCSQMSRPANWATPRFYKIFLKVVKYVVKRISDRDFRETKAPWRCSVKGNMRKTAMRSALTVLCSQMSRPANWATPRFLWIFLKVVKFVVKRISDRDFRETKAPWRCSVKRNVQQTALQSAPTVLCSQMKCDTNSASPDVYQNIIQQKQGFVKHRKIK